MHVPRTLWQGLKATHKPLGQPRHWWGNRFVDLIAACVADALEECSYGLVSRLLQKEGTQCF